MVSLFSLAVVGIFILIIMGIVSNTSENSFTRIEDQIYLMDCPYPIYEGVAENLDIVGLTVNYTIAHDRDINGNTTSVDADKVGTSFECSIVSLGLKSVTSSTHQYAVTTFGFNWGYVGFLADSLTTTILKVQSFLTLFSFILSPANFGVLGYSLTDLSGIALMVVVGVYIVAYVFVATWLWVTFNPFKGGSGG
jgi:hypothetical protein